MKNFLTAIAGEFLYGSHLMALAAIGFTLSTLLILDLPVDGLMLLVSYLICLVIYTYNHLRELAHDQKSNPERVHHLAGKMLWVKTSPFVYLSFLVLALLFSNWQTALLSAFILAGGILYTERLKQIPILGWKTYYVSFFWATLILIVPIYFGSSNFIPYLFIMIFVFMRAVVNTTFSDIKDIESDAQRGVKTFAALWGRRKTLSILQFVNIVSFLPILIGIYTENLPTIALVFGLAILNGVFYLTKAMYTDDKSLRLLTYILLDGEYILWPLVVFITKLILS